MDLETFSGQSKTMISRSERLKQIHQQMTGGIIKLVWPLVAAAGTTSGRFLKCKHNVANPELRVTVRT